MKERMLFFKVATVWNFFRKFRVSCGLMVVFAVKPLSGHIYKKALANDNFQTIICQSFIL